MIKKSIAALLACAAMCLALTSCGDDTSYEGHLQLHSIADSERPDDPSSRGKKSTSQTSFKWKIVHTSSTTTTTTTASSTTPQTTTTTSSAQSGSDSTTTQATTTVHTTVTAAPTYTYAPPTQRVTAAPTYTVPQTLPSSKQTTQTPTQTSAQTSSRQQYTNFTLAQ